MVERVFSIKKIVGTFKCYSQQPLLLSSERSVLTGRSNWKSSYCGRVNPREKNYLRNKVFLIIDKFATRHL